MIFKSKKQPLLACHVIHSIPGRIRIGCRALRFLGSIEDALLRRFVLINIDVDKDSEQSYEQAGARGLPALVPFTRNGRPVAFKLRALEEDGKVRDLGTEEESMITGWQRPQELIVNLQRILDRAG